MRYPTRLSRPSPGSCRTSHGVRSTPCSTSSTSPISSESAPGSHRVPYELAPRALRTRTASPADSHRVPYELAPRARRTRSACLTTRTASPTTRTACHPNSHCVPCEHAPRVTRTRAADLTTRTAILTARTQNLTNSRQNRECPRREAHSVIDLGPGHDDHGAGGGDFVEVRHRLDLEVVLFGDPGLRVRRVRLVGVA